MSKLNFEYVPLTFISDKQEIKKQIRNTLILIYLFEKYNDPVRLEKLIEGTQYGYNASALQSGNNKFLRISDIHESKVEWDSVPYCNCDDEATYLLKNEDILIARTGGTTGKSFKISNPPKRAIYAGYLIRIRAKAEVNPDYIYLFLHSFAYWSQIVNLNERNFRPKANAENLKSLVLPDCPKTVQDEIVRISKGEKLKGYEELFQKIETALVAYDKTQEVENLLEEQLNNVEKLNQSILQEAVQGKLVKQDIKDEPALELLKRIRTEKEKAGKKEKPLPPIKQEEIPFEIPKNWVWCRLGEVIQYAENLDIQKHLSPNTIINYVDIDAIDNKNFIIRESKQKTVRELSTRARRVLKLNYIAYSTVRPYLKNIAIIDEEKENYIGSTGFNVFKTLNVELKYAFYYLLTPLVNNSFKDLMVGFNSPSITNDQFERSLFPLPPLFEQKRIVAEIEKKLAKTKKLKEHIIANQQATEQLLKALLHQAFEVDEKENDLPIAAEPKIQYGRGKVIEFKPTNVDYYKRTVLAAEIVWQLHKEPTLGHLKLQKLIYLCQKTADMQLPTNFARQAMGPYDNQLMRSIDKQFKQKKWFEYNKELAFKYIPLANAGQHQNDFIKYFSSERENIEFLINTFKTIKSDVVEIVATLYACLDNILSEKVIFSETLLFQRFYEWSAEKKKFPEDQVKKVFARMKETGIVPKSFNL